MENQSSDAQVHENSLERQAVKTLIQMTGAPLDDENFDRTPERVVKAWKNEIFVGYGADIGSILETRFSSEADQMVICKDIELYSMCSHHLLPFTGRAHVAYIPNGKVVGLSKLARLVDAFARRAQLQERLTHQIAEALMTHLSPRGVGVVIEASHFCMRMRGVAKQNSTMVTSALEGSFRDREVREEFLNLIKTGR